MHLSAGCSVNGTLENNRVNQTAYPALLIACKWTIIRLIIRLAHHGSITATRNSRTSKTVTHPSLKPSGPIECNLHWSNGMPSTRVLSSTLPSPLSRKKHGLFRDIVAINITAPSSRTAFGWAYSCTARRKPSSLLPASI